MNKRISRLGAAILMTLLSLTSPSAPLLAGAGGSGSEPRATAASGEFFFPPYAASDRMGVAGAIGIYTTTLGAGWYQDWGANAAPPYAGTLAYARTIYFTVSTNACGTGKIPASQRSQVTESITGTALINNLAANPGALWLIGNEPDSIYNCSPIMPALYAELYHEFYTFITSHDPTARVAIAAIVQPSPLRLAYLDTVLDHYQAQYGQLLPTALWNIHLYAFPEVAGFSGAGVPPGASTDTGWDSSWAQTVNPEVALTNLSAMRAWLAERGERDKPLIITEFGQVIPDDGSYCLDGLLFTPDVTAGYLRGAITSMLRAEDPAIGYPADGNRLVQMWAWYSLRDPDFGGDLLNPDGTLTLAGQAFAQSAAYPAGLANTIYLPLIGQAASPAPCT